jgi:hypothetical protein
MVSADGTKDAILWVVSTKEWNETHMDRPAVLHAYDAMDIAHELYNSEQNKARDRADMTVRFAIPTVADGHVFIGSACSLKKPRCRKNRNSPPQKSSLWMTKPSPAGPLFMPWKRPA